MAESNSRKELRRGNPALTSSNLTACEILYYQTAKKLRDPRPNNFTYTDIHGAFPIRQWGTLAIGNQHSYTTLALYSMHFCIHTLIHLSIICLSIYLYCFANSMCLCIYEWPGPWPPAHPSGIPHNPGTSTSKPWHTPPSQPTLPHHPPKPPSHPTLPYHSHNHGGGGRLQGPGHVCIYIYTSIYISLHIYIVTYTV